MFLSRFCKPYRSQTTAETRYAPHDSTEIPAARWLIQILKTWGTVITRVKIDRLPRRRLMSRGWGRALTGWGAGLGGIGAPPSDFNEAVLGVELSRPSGGMVEPRRRAAPLLKNRVDNGAVPSIMGSSMFRTSNLGTMCCCTPSVPTCGGTH